MPLDAAGSAVDCAIVGRSVVDLTLLYSIIHLTRVVLFLNSLGFNLINVVLSRIYFIHDAKL